MRSLTLLLALSPLVFALPARAADGACAPSEGGAVADLAESIAAIPADGPIATAAWVERNGYEYGPGIVYAIVDGRKKVLADDGWGVWIVDGGRYVAFSGADGAGGYENEGQSLRVYDTATGRLVLDGAPVLSEYYMIDRVTSAKADDGRTALVVEMGDGGLGAPHLGIVDPRRGEVFRARIARPIDTTGGAVTVGYYEPGQIEDNLDLADVTPIRTERFDLGELLDRPVIVNEPTR